MSEDKIVSVESAESCCVGSDTWSKSSDDDNLKADSKNSHVKVEVEVKEKEKKGTDEIMMNYQLRMHNYESTLNETTTTIPDEAIQEFIEEQQITKVIERLSKQISGISNDKETIKVLETDLSYVKIKREELSNLMASFRTFETKITTYFPTLESYPILQGLMKGQSKLWNDLILELSELEFIITDKYSLKKADMQRKKNEVRNIKEIFKTWSEVSYDSEDEEDKKEHLKSSITMEAHKDKWIGEYAAANEDSYNSSGLTAGLAAGLYESSPSEPKQIYKKVGSVEPKFNTSCISSSAIDKSGVKSDVSFNQACCYTGERTFTKEDEFKTPHDFFTRPVRSCENFQIRADPPIGKVFKEIKPWADSSNPNEFLQVGPWMTSTIKPDVEPVPEIKPRSAWTTSIIKPDFMNETINGKEMEIMGKNDS